MGGRSAGAIIPLVVLPVLIGAAAYSWRLLNPDLVASARAADIDENLVYVLNHMAALSGAGVLPAAAFGSIGRQTVYGELAKEAAWIERDVNVFNRDLVLVLRDAAARSPSPRWAEFLLGSVNTVTSGGDLKKYVLAKADQFEQEARRQQRSFLEGMGIMAESYVVVAAAAPLFLLIVLSVMSLISSKVADPTFLLNILVFVAMPILHGAFTWLLGNITPSS